MKPYYQDKYATIFLGDCLELLPEMPKVDLVLTDPQYGVGVEYDNGTDDDIDYVKKCSDGLFNSNIDVKRIVICCGIKTAFCYPQPDWILCWSYAPSTNKVCCWGFNQWTPILVYGKDPCLEKCLGSRPDTIHDMVPPEKNHKHPTPKPLSFMKKLLLRVSVNKLEVILDPFMGSGTTLVAAKQLNRKAIGIEIEERYCQIAAQRLSQEVLDLA